MNEINLNNITFFVATEGTSVRIKTKDDDIILVNQTAQTIINIVKRNFNVVNNFFMSNVNTQSAEEFNISDIDRISASIVLHYIYMYNLWNNSYTKKKNHELLFSIEDFTHSGTYDIIITFFKKKYPYEWKHKVAILIGMPFEDFNRFSIEREKFYNK